jgi:hypothetical protein
MRDLLLGRSHQELNVPGLATELGARRSGLVRLATGPRSSGYLGAVRKLDAGTGSRIDVSDVVEYVMSEFGPSTSVPLGLVATCFLGAPYEVHVLDLAGVIVEHYKAGQTLPDPFEAARALAQHSAYLVVEVYSDRLVCIHSDGSATEVRT